MLIFLVGLSMLLYPSVSDDWNSLHQSRAITEYAEQVANLDDDRYDELWQEAQDYNKTLLTKADRYELSDEEQAEYESLLNVSGNGIIGYIEIPAINALCPSTTALMRPFCRSPWDRLREPPCRRAARAPTASSPDTGDCPAQGSLPILTNWRRAASSSCGFWTRP